MTEYELSVVRDTTELALFIGVPGISDKMRDAIINNIVLRLRHELDIPAPYLANVVVNG